MQNPDELDDIRCDACGGQLGFEELYVLLPVHSFKSGVDGPGVMVCAKCAKSIFSIDLKTYTEWAGDE